MGESLFFWYHGPGTTLCELICMQRGESASAGIGLIQWPGSGTSLVANQLIFVRTFALYVCARAHVSVRSMYVLTCAPDLPLAIAAYVCVSASLATSLQRLNFHRVALS